ncbi:hypothetical protein [Phycicoccus sp.]|uniref:hypothetical protein n=1 Tax=Phycicoccus sp. TaxID=1902410 RepID=UPI002C4D406E|nr:hypothetical protein [Phycicoccus sp.]HMM95302.1 hypothetical protein [Phycicoccus sp.]
MSTAEDRAWDAERDARTPCPDCAAEGFATSDADCPGHAEREVRAAIFLDGRRVELADVPTVEGTLIDVVVDVGDGMFSYVGRVEDDGTVTAIASGDLRTLARTSEVTREQLDELRAEWDIPAEP